jgi:hydroxyacylglutathione hydrolase
VYCAHEYTLANIRWARAVEPANGALVEWETQAQALRDSGTPTVPTTLALEREVNPFLRTNEPAVAEAAVTHAGRALATRTEVFAALREWKNSFK